MGGWAGGLSTWEDAAADEGPEGLVVVHGGGLDHSDVCLACVGVGWGGWVGGLWVGWSVMRWVGWVGWGGLGGLLLFTFDA